ncbi:hypothetical protein [uncultured Clostridium sp.]|uniref:hypothetical protein n=1 Tax=uncultured Clostridium sp. TaxID=59620 RepID=UPI003217010E
MKNNKKYIIILIVAIFAITGVVSYTYLKGNRIINDFSNYVVEYKDGISKFLLNSNEEKYQALINKCDQIIVNKEYKKVEGLKEELNQFKDNLTNSNIELINKGISELEAIDISKLKDKDLIINKIEELKSLRDKKEFVDGNEKLKALKAEINDKLEIKRQEEEKAKAEAEARAKAEAEAKAQAEARAKVEAEAASKAQVEAETQTQGEINNQEDTQSTNESEIIIDIPTPYIPTRIENPYFN